FVDGITPLAQHLTGRLQDLGIVVDQQDPRPRLGCRRRAGGEGEIEGERRAPSRLAVDVEPAAVPPDDLVRNEEADAEAAVVPGRSICGAEEALEEARLFFLRYPDSGVADRDARLVAGPFHHDCDLSALRRVLDGVGHAIDQYL